MISDGLGDFQIWFLNVALKTVKLSSFLMVLTFFHGTILGSRYFHFLNCFTEDFKTLGKLGSLAETGSMLGRLLTKVVIWTLVSQDLRIGDQNCFTEDVKTPEKLDSLPVFW